jgi:tetratricopeptide (TPR) repeat protein
MTTSETDQTPLHPSDAGPHSQDLIPKFETHLQTIYLEARELLIKKDYEGSLTKYNKYTSDYSQFAGSTLPNPQELARFKSAQQKKLAIVYTNLSVCHRNTGNASLAVELATKAGTCDTDYLKSYFRKAEALRDLKQYKLALTEC